LVQSKLRRGFVTEANKWALELREELGVAPNAPLSPWKLSALLEVPIYKLSALPKCDEQLLLLEKRNGHDFSAAVCFDRRAAFIVVNDGHELKRQASDIAHELAHIVLRHPAANPFTNHGVREFAPEHELEAERLGPTLLISDPAAMRAVRLIEHGSYDLASLSNEWMISQEVIRMRMNLSGARKRFQRAA